MTLSSVSFAIKAGGAAIAALWLGLAPVVQILLVLMALDIATGLFAAYVRRGLDSMVSGRGVAKKASELLVVAAALSEEFGVEARDFDVRTARLVSEGSRCWDFHDARRELAA
jgi:hypothetical protein